MEEKKIMRLHPNLRKTEKKAAKPCKYWILTYGKNQSTYGKFQLTYGKKSTYGKNEIRISS